MPDWFKGLQPPQATIIAAILGSFITVLVTIATMSLKDFLFPILTEKRAYAKKRNETFKLYANPLILSSISLLYRLKEILSHRGRFLRSDAPQNDFYDYKRLSTLYRFCAFLGWVRASTLELSIGEVRTSSEYYGIQSAIFEFEKALADGHDLELAILGDLANLWKIDISSVSADEKDKLGTRIENVTDDYCFRGNSALVCDLAEENKLALAIELNTIITTAVQKQRLSDTEIGSTLIDFSNELSRKDGLIYRDWQAAIGEQMLVGTDKESRRYRVIGFKEFEALFNSKQKESDKWFGRAAKIFNNLDVSVEDRFDGRIKQLKLLYSCIYKVLKAFSKIKTSEVDMASKALKNLEEKLP